ncbi:MAG: hypothetical protein NVSMB27_50490 [Ktedonobacteraceae bacterium]
MFLRLCCDEETNEQVLLQHVQRDIWELFANIPLDSFAFTEDPNQETTYAD